MVVNSLLLSAQLRTQTAALHRQIEAQLALPGAIQTRDDYRVWLSGFLGFYDPLERWLATFDNWEALEFARPTRSHTACLTSDLAILGADPASVPRMSAASLPDLPTFPHALGALYVLEGATLGGRLILRDLESRIGSTITGACQFFGGRGQAVGPMWHHFRSALDRFGDSHPQYYADVITGAQRAFHAMLAWFAQFFSTLENVT